MTTAELKKMTRKYCAGGSTTSPKIVLIKPEVALPAQSKKYARSLSPRERVTSQIRMLATIR